MTILTCCTLSSFSSNLQLLPKNAIFCQISALACSTSAFIKIDPGVVHTFRDRFWKAKTSYFPILRKFWKFGSFCNPNGIHQIWSQKREDFTAIPFWLQKGMKIEKFVDAIIFLESMDPQLSKTGLGICLRPLVMILWPFEVLWKCRKKGGRGELKKKRHNCLQKKCWKMQK